MYLRSYALKSTRIGLLRFLFEIVWKIRQREITHSGYFESINNLEGFLIPCVVEWKLSKNALKVLWANERR